MITRDEMAVSGQKEAFAKALADMIEMTDPEPGSITHSLQTSIADAGLTEIGRRKLLEQLRATAKEPSHDN